MGDILENGIYNEAHQCKDSADGTDHPQEMQHNGTASQVKEAPPLPTGRELQDMPRSQKIGRTTCVTLMFFCQVLDKIQTQSHYHAGGGLISLKQLQIFHNSYMHCMRFSHHVLFITMILWHKIKL